MLSKFLERLRKRGRGCIAPNLAHYIEREGGKQKEKRRHQTNFFQPASPPFFSRLPSRKKRISLFSCGATSRPETVPKTQPLQLPFLYWKEWISSPRKRGFGGRKLPGEGWGGQSKNKEICQKFRKGVGGQRGLARRNPSCARDSGLFSVPFFLCPLEEGGTHFWRTFLVLSGGLFVTNPLPPTPFLSGPLRLRVQSRLRTRLGIAASIAFLFRACLKGFLETVAPPSRG